MANSLHLHYAQPPGLWPYLLRYTLVSIGMCQSCAQWVIQAMSCSWQTETFLPHEDWKYVHMSWSWFSFLMHKKTISAVMSSSPYPCLPSVSASPPWCKAGVLNGPRAQRPRATLLPSSAAKCAGTGGVVTTPGAPV